MANGLFVSFYSMTLNNLYKHIIENLSDIANQHEASSIAYLLLEHFTSYDKLYVCLNPNMEVEDSIVEKIDEAIMELQNQKPVQYVLGETIFCDLPFLVNESVLIPRPETEELVNWVLADSPHADKILDICTGSGSIGIALAYYLKSNQVYAVDISDKALQTAQKNAQLNNINIHFSKEDILSSDFMNECNLQFDVIVSNPPYVRESEKQYISERVLNFEPSLALFVEDDDPLLFYRKIMQFGQSHLTDKGKLYFEINEAFGKEIMDLFSEYAYHDIILRKDIHGKDRMISGKLLMISR